MKILILVLSCLDEPYYSLMKKQQDTWDNVENENIKTIYYYGNGGGLKKVKNNSYEYGAECSDSYKMMHWKFYLLLKEIISDDWDYVFRTNSSSYVDKENLLKFSENLPSKNCYCGINAGYYASGSGIFLSRDVVEILLNSDYSSDEIDYEDMYIGDILKSNNVCVTPGAKRIDLDSNYNLDIDTYHFRCKSDINRQLDLKRFEEIYEKMKNRYDNR
jgi:hypothetical protein